MVVASMTEPLDDARACENTDREIWRGPDEGGGDYYADSLHITKGGGLGINCGGSVYVKPIREWHRLAGGPISGLRPAPVPQCEAEPVADRVIYPKGAEFDVLERAVAEAGPMLYLQGHGAVFWAEEKQTRLVYATPPSRLDAESAELTQFLLRQLDGPMPASTEVLAKELSCALLTRFPLVPPPSEAVGGLSIEHRLRAVRLTAIEECAQLVEKTSLRNHDNIARDIRALSPDPGTVAVASTNHHTPGETK